MVTLFGTTGNGAGQAYRDFVSSLRYPFQPKATPMEPHPEQRGKVGLFELAYGGTISLDEGRPDNC